jgi:hypothetical protein
MKRKKLIWMIPVGIVGMALFIALGGEIVRLLWNSLLPALFGLREITFWQGLGLLVLCRILFGGFGFHGSGGSNARRRMRDRMAERWESMTPEDRERFRVYMRERCGFSRPFHETKPSE